MGHYSLRKDRHLASLASLSPQFTAATNLASDQVASLVFLRVDERIYSSTKASSNDAFVGKLGRVINYSIFTYKAAPTIDMSPDSSDSSCELCTYGSYKPPELLACSMREWNVA